MPKIVVVMGVAGSGRTTVGMMVADAMHCAFLEGDSLHSAANVEADMLASQFEALEEPSDALIGDVSQSPGAIVEQILAELRGPAHADMAGSTDRRKGDA